MKTVRGAILLYRDDCELTEVLENLICNEINIEEIKLGFLFPCRNLPDFSFFNNQESIRHKVIFSDSVRE